MALVFARDRRSRHICRTGIRQEVTVDLKSNIFWAIASIALITSAMLLEPGPTDPMMAGYTEKADASAG